MKPLELPGLVTKGDESAWALTSEDNVYRYALGRCWAPELPVFDITMINPSTARHDVPDPTMDKVVHYAKQEGCGGILIRNLAALSSSNKKDLLPITTDIVGPRNLEVLALDLCADAYTLHIRVAAWGRFDTQRVRRRLLNPMSYVKARGYIHVFGLTKDGEPRHPLYLRNDTRVLLWAAAQQQNGVRA
jgi:hypothetical protein